MSGRTGWLAGLLLLTSAAPAFALTLTPLEDHRIVGSRNPQEGDWSPPGGSPSTAFAPWSFEYQELGLAGVTRLTQQSEITALGMRGSGSAASPSGPYNRYSQFLVEFSLDDSALFSFEGVLSVRLEDTPNGALAALCREWICSESNSVTFDFLGRPTNASYGRTDQAFSHTGELAAGTYWLWVQGLSVDAPSSFDFVFSVAAVPEPALASLALLALLPFARRARR